MLQNSPSFSIPILLEDKEILVLVKPVGMPSQPDPTGAADVFSFVKSKRGEAYLVHRLDRMTGGVMVFAKTRRAARSLSSAMAHRDEEGGGALRKTYLALAGGQISAPLTLSDYLLQDRRAQKSRVVSAGTAGAREARLIATPLGFRPTSGGEATLLSVELLTGRFHQIRAQLSAVGHPLLGDGKYGSRVKCPLALYSHSLSFPHPLSGETVSVTAPAPSGEPWQLFSDLMP